MQPNPGKKIDDESQLSNYKQTNHEYKTRWYMQIVAAAKLTNHRNNKSQPTNNNKIIRKIFAAIASRNLFVSNDFKAAVQVRYTGAHDV